MRDMKARRIIKKIKNNYTNFILTVIAIAMIGILFKGEIISASYADFSYDERQSLTSSAARIVGQLGDIASAIRSCK